MDRIELPYFNIGKAYGGSQSWFMDPWMHIGGCGALTMCDLMIYFAMHRSRPECCPFDVSKITRRDYVRFGMRMKPYLRPRAMGIKDLRTFIDGAADYLTENRIRGISMERLDGHEKYETAERLLKEQIENGIPVPMLMLKHQDRKYNFFEWHWFLINGFEYRGEHLYIKAATYAKAHWLRFDQFWDTGEEERGGLIIIHTDDGQNIQGIDR